MAHKVQTMFVDDLDGGEAAGTVRFGLDGTEYEIDLSTAHSDELRRTLDQYVAHARRAGNKPRRGARGGRGRRVADAVDTHKVREWAREHGFDIKDRGRVPASAIEQYKAADGT